ncbi:tripartite tricarboxylate transporter substrate binding protein [Comamonas humi]
MHSLPSRRTALSHAILAAAMLLPAMLAQAQSSPTIRLVVPFAAGGAQDVIGRYLADKLTQRLGSPVIVENKAGAGGIIAAEAVAKAAPDGNTLLLATGGAISIAPHLQAKMPYDAHRDFLPVAMVADTPMTLATSTASPYKSVADVVREAKARPGALAYASTGNGTVSHLTGELFAQTTSIQLLHTPYRGAAPALNDLLGGQVPLIVTSTASIDPQVKAGKARVLATFTAQRVSTFKDVPTMAEAGVKGLEVPVWVGVMAPARTPTEKIEKLSAELVAVCQLPETHERFKGLGADAACAGAQAFGKVVSEDDRRWGQVIKAGNITAN